MSIYYRYIRPVRIDEQRFELTTLSQGGVCLRFESHESGNVWFSHARCHPDESFSKHTARKIADRRAKFIDQRIKNSMNFLESEMRDHTSMVSAIANWCKAIEPSTYPLLMAYAQDEFHQLGLALLQIVSANNMQQEQLDDIMNTKIALQIYKSLTI